MSLSRRLSVSTANESQSIWRGLGRDTFRRHIVALQQASREIPDDPVVHSTNKWLASRSARYGKEYSLPFEVEQRLVDDIAFIAAAEEGPKEVSAVALEEHLGHQSLIFRVAANEKLPNGVEDMLKAAFRLLSQCASRKLPRDACAQSIFDLVVQVENNRIHGRLESIHWKKPGSRVGAKERRPLYLELRKLAQQLERRRLPVQTGASLLTNQIRELSGSLQAIDSIAGNNEKGKLLLAQAIKQSHDLCTSGGTSTLDETILRYGLDPAEVCTNKYIRQLDKIGRYWGLCRSMTEDSRRYPGLFADVQLVVLRPYEGSTSQISYINGQRARCLVHAEIQLIVFYGRNPKATVLKPRVLGASKSACYLCNLFIQYHGQFFVTKTHGHLYDRWNFPDLADFGGAERDEYRRILLAMDRELQAATVRECRSRRKRGHPTGSWLTLPPTRQLSPVPSTVLSSDLEGKVPPHTTVPSALQSLPKSSSQHPTAGPITPPVPTALSAAAISRSARAERLKRRNLLKEVQNTRKVRGSPEKSPASSRPKTLATPAPRIKSGPLDAKPSTDPLPPAPPPPEVSPIPSSPSTLAPSAPAPIASPVPTSPPATAPAAISSDHLLGPEPRVAAHEVPDPTPHTTVDVPSSPSSSSIQSWEYPVERAITANSPFRAKHGNLNLTVEIEGPFQGNVAIARSSANEKPAAGIPVNVRAMRENETLHFEKRNEDDRVVLNLNHAGTDSTQISLQWG